MKGAIAGKIVTETFDYDEGRKVTVYVPSNPPEAIVFAGDGQMISQWGGILEAANLPPTMIVGAHRVADETLRLHEYSPRLRSGTICRTREVFHRRRRCVGEVAFRGNSVRRSYGGVWCFRKCGARPRHWASTSRLVQGHLRSLARRGVPAAKCDAESAAAHVPRGRHAGTVFPRERGSMGGRAARCICRGRDERKSRGTRRGDVARGASANDSVGVWP